MNIQKKVVPIEIEGKEYELVLDFDSAITFQSCYGKSIFVGLSNLSQEQDLVAMSCLVASCLKDETGKAVGLDFVRGLDFISYFELFISKLTELVDNSIPNAKEDKKKAKKK